jgi:hypothetical protein
MPIRMQIFYDRFFINHNIARASLDLEKLSTTLTGMYRRLCRIFIHTYYEHNELFFKLEVNFDNYYCIDIDLYPGQI